MKTILTTDWSPHIEQAARRIAPVLVTVYCLGWALGKWLHRLNDQLAGSSTPALQPMIVQYQAAAAAPANIAPPVLIHISDPMARAIGGRRITHEVMASTAAQAIVSALELGGVGCGLVACLRDGEW